jgi:regulation of enolase protein 1 (concanavalin A-like superfamily)
MFVVVFTVAVRIASAQSTVPSPWTARDIGNPTHAGSTTFNSEVFTVAAGGSEIAGASDQFHFVYQAVSGDTRLVARIDSLVPADPWSKVGLMIRSSLQPNAAHGFSFVSGGRGLAFYRRIANGGTTTSTAGNTSTVAPSWLAIERVGDRITASASPNGSTWITIGSDTVALGQTAYVGIAVTARGTNQRAQSDISSVALSGGFPSGQSHQDIGSPSPAGSATYNQGQYTITSAGSDIWGTSDQFHFVYQPVSGNTEIVARVSSLNAVNSWSKAGVMIRETLSAGSRNAMSFVSGSSGYSFQQRTSTGGGSDYTLGGNGRAPGWVKLVRTGNRFEGYRSSDGQSWTLMGSTDITMAATVYVGLAVTSHMSGTTTTSVLDNVRISAPTANQPPTVSMTSPSSGSSFTSPASITLSATAGDPEGRLSRVEFYGNNSLVGTDTGAPFSRTWSSVTAGTYRLTAIAYDADGGQTTSPEVTVTVGGGNAPPTVTITSPTNGTTMPAPATVTITANASDPEGRLTRVEFYAGSTQLGSDATAPYTSVSTNVAAGSYTLTAVAFDADGGRTTSAPVNMSVSSGSGGSGTTTVAFTASSDHATNVTSYRLNVYAAGANPATATPINTSDLGKPTPAANNEIRVDRTSFINGLATGTYIATVSAIGPGGQTRSSPINFTR